MKKLISVIALVALVVACAFAQKDPQDLGQLAGTTGTAQTTQAGGQEFPVVNSPPANGGGVLINSSVSTSVQTGDEDFNKPVGQPTNNRFYNDNRTYNKYVRTGTTRTMPQPQPQPINVTVNVPQQSSVGLPNDPDFDGLMQADPNLAIREGASMTYSRNADGGLYYNSTPSGGGFPWILILGILALVALAAIVAAVAAGNRGGGHTVREYRPQPDPRGAAQAAGHFVHEHYLRTEPPAGGAAQPAPFVPQPQPGPNPPGGAPGTGGPRPEEPGWTKNVVVMMAHPTGNLPVEKPKRQDPPVVVHIYNNQPPQKEAQEKKTAAKATPEQKKK